jgi:hypothetical protein
MKKIYLALLAMTLGLSANAQRNIILQASITKPALDTNITTGSTQNPIFWLKNVSATAADSLMNGDTIRIVSPLSTIVGSSSISVSSFITSGSLRKGDSMSVTVTGGVPFANINTLMTLTGDTVVAAPFTNNKQYNWYFQFASAKAPSTNIAIASSAPSSTTFAKRRIWINKSTGIEESFATIQALKTYPNPAVNQLSFDYNFTRQESATAKILDATGRTILVKEFENNSGNQKFDLDINSLNTGSYILQFIVGDKTMMSKFNVQK